MKRESMYWTATQTTSGLNGAKSTSLVRFADIAPFISVAIISSALFFVAFAKMEVRRLGYEVLKLSREEYSWRDRERDLVIKLAKATRPERLAAMAEQKLTLRKAESGQIIQMTESGLALEQ